MKFSTKFEIGYLSSGWIRQELNSPRQELHFWLFSTDYKKYDFRNIKWEVKDRKCITYSECNDIFFFSFY